MKKLRIFVHTNEKNSFEMTLFEKGGGVLISVDFTFEIKTMYKRVHNGTIYQHRVTSEKSLFLSKRTAG